MSAADQTPARPSAPGRSSAPVQLSVPARLSVPVQLSVVVPARDAGPLLRACLERLAASSRSDFETIVVDDASTDDTGDVARAHGARVIHLARQGGPAAARNAGAGAARAELLLFIDADVGVHPDTIDRVIRSFETDARIDALFGSYDDRPAEPAFLSRYRNLQHHFVHQHGRERASTFWSGCGAMRRAVFLDHGGFDQAAYERPSIEDIELGVRLCRAGHRIALQKDIQVTHLKRWTLWGMIRTDVRDRGVPWTRLVLASGGAPDDLNLRRSQRLSGVFALALLAAWLVGAWSLPTLLLLPLLAYGGVLAADGLTRRDAAAPAALVVGALTGVGCLLVLAPGVAGDPGVVQVATRAMALLLLLLVLLNLAFYRFMARATHPLLLPLVVPLQLLYYLYATLAFAVGTLLHLLRRPVTT